MVNLERTIKRQATYIQALEAEINVYRSGDTPAAGAGPASAAAPAHVAAAPPPAPPTSVSDDGNGDGAGVNGGAPHVPGEAAGAGSDSPLGADASSGGGSSAEEERAASLATGDSLTGALRLQSLLAEREEEVSRLRSANAEAERELKVGCAGVPLLREHC